MTRRHGRQRGGNLRRFAPLLRRRPGLIEAYRNGNHMAAKTDPSGEGPNIHGPLTLQWLGCAGDLQRAIQTDTTPAPDPTLLKNW